MQIEIERARLRGDTAAADEAERRIALLHEELRLLDRIFEAETRERRGESPRRVGSTGGGRGVSTGQAPAPAAPAVVRGGTEVHVHIEGLLDISDRGSLDAIARRLRPVFNDLDRRGV